MGSTKSMVGHLLGAAGATEAIICALVIREGKIPPTINFSDPDPDCDLDYGHNRMVERPVELAMSNSFGFGGHNVTLAIRAVGGVGTGRSVDEPGVMIPSEKGGWRLGQAPLLVGTISRTDP